MTRSNAREIAVHAVYSALYNDMPTDEMLSSRLEADYYANLGKVCDVYAQKPDAPQIEYISRIVSGVAAHREELDERISRNAVGWKLGRIAAIARAILEVALYEILYADDVPAGAAINEAVELSKRYVEAETTAFINGVLGTCVKEVEADVSGN